MMKTRLVRTVSIILLATLLLSDVTPLGGPPKAAHAQAPVANAVIGLFNIFSAMRRRNRVYHEARVTQGEMNAYYGDLIEEAQQQLVQNELMGTSTLTSEQRNRLRVYIKLTNALRAEQQAVTQQIENEKNQARQEFNQRLGQELFNVLAQSPGGQHLIGDIRKTVDEVRQLAEGIRTAMANGRPYNVLGQQLEDKVHSNIPLLQNAAYNIGQAAGHKLDQFLGGVITKVDQAMAGMQADMGEALDEINKIDNELAQLDNTDRTPVSAVEEGDQRGELHGIDRANAVIDVAAQAYTNAAFLSGSVRNPSSTEKSNMRDRIRQQLLQNRLDQLAQVGQHATHVVCDGAGAAAYASAMAELGRTPEKPADPNSARYLICRDRETGAIIHAALIGAALAETTTTPEGLAAETEEVSPTDTVVATEPPEPPEDRCSLSGEGDFVIEQVIVSNLSASCPDIDYPFGNDVDPILLLLAAGGKWVPSSSSPEGDVWTWQSTQAVQEGGYVYGTATSDGTTLDIDVKLGMGEAGLERSPFARNGNGIILAGLVPLFPLALVLSLGKRRRILLLGLCVLSLLLTAQSCVPSALNVTGHYSFPLSEDGFPCEVPIGSPDIAVMPGATGSVSMYAEMADESGATESCSMQANVSGRGVLKADGVYTESPLQ